MSYYVYLHRKKTTGDVFYVGKGTGSRCNSSSNRSGAWNNTVNKHGFVVEIFAENIQEWYAFELEKDLINLYGRRDIGFGPLVNHTDGGEGISGYKHSQEVKDNNSILSSGLNNPRADLNTYSFVNIHSKEKFIGTRFELEKKINKRISDLFKKNILSVNDWALDHNIDSIKHHSVDINIYCFRNLNKEEFTGTRVEFKRKFNIDTKPLFCSKQF